MDSQRTLALALLSTLAVVGSCSRIDHGRAISQDQAGSGARIRSDALEQGPRCGYMYPNDENHTVDFSKDGFAAKCQDCLAVDPRCKWCPFSGQCYQRANYFGAGDGKCPTRGGVHDAIDNKITKKVQCFLSPPWHQLLTQAYGDAFKKHPENWSDAVRCMQWVMGWAMDKDPYEKMWDQPSDVQGSWACTSILVREGILGLLGQINAPVTKEPGLSEGEKVTAATWSSDRTEWRPGICDFISQKFKKERCYVRAHGINIWRELNQAAAMPNGQGGDISHLLLESARSGPLITYEPGAGKSGSRFALTADKKYAIKLGIKYTTKMNEPKNLMMLLHGVTASGEQEATLAEHLHANPQSLLNRYHGMVKISFGGDSDYVLIMDDAFYDVRDKSAEVSFKYDLKGSSRKSNDETQRPFREQQKNKFYLGPEQCELFRDAVEKDTKFLKSYSLIDYSFLTLVQSPGTMGCQNTAREPFCFETTGPDGPLMYTVSIIDYLVNFNTYKWLESKVVMPGKFFNYDVKMNNFAEQICPTRGHKEFVDKLQQIIQRKFGSVIVAFTRADADGNGKLDREELDAFLGDPEMGMGLPEQERKKLFVELDAIFDDDEDIPVAEVDEGNGDGGLDSSIMSAGSSIGSIGSSQGASEFGVTLRMWVRMLKAFEIQDVTDDNGYLHVVTDSMLREKESS